MTTKSAYTTALDLIGHWSAALHTGEAPKMYQIGAPEWHHVEIGPGLVMLLGGPPGTGKTALSMQVTVEALRFDQTIRALVCNVEMEPTALLDRQLARLSGIHLTTIRRREFGIEHTQRIAAGLVTIESFAGRLAFLQFPYDLANVAAAADAFQPQLLVLDYIQRIEPPGKYSNRKSAIDATMNFLRRFAKAGMAVLAISAVARSKDNHNRSGYDAATLNMASFRESSELEYGADNAFLLIPGRKLGGQRFVLRHLKNRHGERKDLHLDFDGARQSFTPAPPEALHTFEKVNSSHPSDRSA